MSAAIWLARGLEAYALAGALFSVPFLARGVEALDPAARGAGVLFRLLIAPGVILLWPLLVMRWMRS